MTNEASSFLKNISKAKGRILAVLSKDYSWHRDKGPVETYTFPVKPMGNILSVTVGNGDGLPTAFVATVRFIDNEGGLVPTPYSGFTVSSALGAYRYVRGGSRNSPRRTEMRFDAPPTAASMRLALVPWRFKGSPHLESPPAMSDTEQEEELARKDEQARLDLLAELIVPAAPALGWHRFPAVSATCFTTPFPIPQGVTPHEAKAWPPAFRRKGSR